MSYPIETDEQPDYPPLWSLFKPIYRCPKCGSTAFRLISHVTVYDTLYFDEEDGTPTLELEESGNVTEGLDPFYADEVECAECGEPIPKEELFKNINRNEVEITF